MATMNDVWDGTLALITDAATPVATTAEQKTHMRVSASDEDTYIDTLVAMATKYVQGYTGRQLITATFDMYLQGFPDEILIPRPPVQSVTHLKYYASDTGTLTALTATTEYVLSTVDEPGKITLPYNVSWPTPRAINNTIVCRFVAGYGDASTDVPEDLVWAVKVIAANAFENRENTITGTIVNEIPDVQRVLDMHKVFWI